jgi:hypothetical protein
MARVVASHAISKLIAFKETETSPRFQTSHWVKQMNDGQRFSLPVALNCFVDLTHDTEHRERQTSKKFRLPAG